jgi:hypothetical protein
MLHEFVLYLEIGRDRPVVNINLNNQRILPEIEWNKDSFGNISINFRAVLQKQNMINIVFNNATSPIKIKDIVINGIKLGLVLFLCTTVSGKQDTQINSDGQLDIAINTPIWSWWCAKLNSFNYEDYPLGTIG